MYVDNVFYLTIEPREFVYLRKIVKFVVFNK